MTRRAVRLTLFAALLLALGTAAWHTLRLEQQLDIRTREGSRIDRAAARLWESVIEARAAQRAYAAPGQGAPFWKRRVDAAHATIRDALHELRESARSAAAHEALESALDALDEVERVERRLAAHAEADRRSHAEDLVFADALQASLALERHARTGAAAIQADLDTAAGAVRTRQGLTLAGAGLLALLVTWILVRERRETAAGEVQAGAPSPEPAEPQPLERERGPRFLDLPMSPDPPTEIRKEPAAGPAARTEESEDRLPSPRALHVAADVCAALARAQDPSELPALVERMGAALDARGTIVWVASPSAGSLRPLFSQGYPPDALGRLGTIAIDGDTPAALAFQRGEARTVDGGPHGRAALVVPMVSSAGALGVITIELPPGNALQPSTIALGRIFAAQLAGLIAPAPASEPDEASPVGETARAAGPG